MRVGVIATSLTPQPTGVGRYTRSLLDALATSFPSNDYLALAPHLGADPWEAGRDVPLVRRRPLWETWRPAQLESSLALDAIIAPGGVKSFLRPAGRTRRIQVIHDLSPIELPSAHRLRTRFEFRHLLPRSIRNCHAVVTDSQAARASLVRFLPDLGDREIFVVPPGVDEIFFSPTARPTGLPSEYFLFIGAQEPRKNLSRLLAAFETYRADGGTADLVLAGPQGWRNRAFEQALRRSPARAHVARIGYVPRAELPGLYAGAIALVFPSLLEGFGLPVVEAMAAGCPVITSSRSSLSEVGEGATLLVDPTSVPAIADAMGQIAADENMRRRMASVGRKRAGMFTWNATARGMQSVIDGMAGGA